MSVLVLLMVVVCKMIFFKKEIVLILESEVLDVNLEFVFVFVKN